ncbi:MAG: hypothetical protein IPJ61_19700 [Tessaracoccus sp.]|uniref:hypothetical protein n=1 Tax=Tessaracoccus sp. TaxID=1971211 RepID=UPI001ED029D6|nr:hypothetical protein [Tessaracoccus sp.]MBK7823212.1 hypothetical protein [Tessaracoccus sp.]
MAKTCNDLKKARAQLWREFVYAGGRGVDLANRIDTLDRAIARCTRTARRSKPRRPKA